MQVFSDQWFRANQAKLVKLANTKLGRWAFDIKDKGGTVMEVLPSSYAILKDISSEKRTGFMQSNFHTYPKYAIELRENLKYVWKSMHFIDSLILDHQKLVPDFGFYTYQVITQGDNPDTINPDWEGDFGRSVSDPGETWTTIRDGAGNVTDFNDSVESTRLAPASGTNGWRSNRRAILCFDTINTALQGSALVTDSVLRTWTTRLDYSYWSGSDKALALVNVIPADILNPAAADYGNFYSTRLATDTAFTSVPNNTAYLSVTMNDYFNVSHLDFVNGTPIGWVFAGDVDSSTPTWQSTTGFLETIGFYTDKNSSGRDAPRLTITYEYPIQISDGATSWREATDIQVNIGDTWKSVTACYVNIGDVWKIMFGA